MIYFAGRELANNLSYLKNQGKENDIIVNYPKFLQSIIKVYISIFGIPEIGLQERFNFFQKCLNKVSGRVFVDAGCGNGINARYVANKFPVSKIYAFDIKNKLINLNRKITPQKNVIFMTHDLVKPLSQLKNKIDVLYCIDVLEHIRDYKKALKNFITMIKKNGYLIIHIPLPNQRRWFNFFKTWEHKTHTHQGIEVAELIVFLKENGQKIIKQTGTFGLIGSLLWELNTLSFKYFPVAGAFLFPILRWLLFLDHLVPSKKYNGIGILTQKIIK